MGDLIQMNSALPAHIRAAFKVEANDDLTAGVTMGYPILSYKGKVWHVAEGDDRTLIANDDGDPVPSIEVVILKANPHISKTYYRDGYEEGSNEKPLCYSADSVAPAPDSVEPQAKKCAVCKWNQFGSKISESGARGKACSDFRRLAVAPSGDLERAMLLRVPAASLKELVTYAESLKKRGYPYQSLITKVGFDHAVSYPKLSFTAKGWIDAEDVPIVAEMIEREVVASITAENAATQAEATNAPDGLDDLPPPPAHVVTQATEAVPAATRRKAVATEAEVAAVIETVAATPAAEPAPKKATGFGGSTKAKAEPAPVAQTAAAAPVEDKVTVLADGALAELDAVLSGFDD